MTISRSIHVAANDIISFFLQMSNILLCVCVYIYVYVYIYMYMYVYVHVSICTYVYMYIYVYVCIYIYHIFFIHSSVSGHLGCFHDLAIVNSAAVNIGVHVYFVIMAFSGYMPRSGIAGSYDSSIFCF